MPVYSWQIILQSSQTMDLMTSKVTLLFEIGQDRLRSVKIGYDGLRQIRLIYLSCYFNCDLIWFSITFFQIIICSRDFIFSRTCQMNRNTSDLQQKTTTYTILFIITKKVKFGQALYVCGNVPELGSWNPENSFRLQWKEGDIWHGILEIPDHSLELLEFKHLISNFDTPKKENLDWQTGSHNRKIHLKNQKHPIICQNKWNIDKIYINIKVSTNKLQSLEKYYIVGDILQLGNWKQKKLMKRVNNKMNFSDGKENARRNGQQVLAWTLYGYHFQMYRSKEEFSYFFMKKSQGYECQSKPYRSFRFQKEDSLDNGHLNVSYQKGFLCLTDQSRINQLFYSQITENIFVGTYPKSLSDIQKLKSNNITAVLSIQSQKDFKSHGLASHYINLLCRENNINYKKYSIQDMNSQDFIAKAQGAVNLLNQFIKNNERVYIHCSAGKYRSPQIIALYLILHERRGIQEVYEMIKEKHAQARPNMKVIRDSINRIKLRRSMHKLYC